MKNNEAFDISRLILSIADVHEFSGLLNSWHWTAQGGRFHFVLALTSDGMHAFQMNTRDYFDADVVRSVLAFALQHEAAVCAASPIALFNGFVASESNFDTVIAVSPAVHQLHKAERPELHAVTIRVFPAYRCEFSGLETQKEAQLRCSKMIDPANLKRDPNPLVRIRYENTRTRSRTLGDNRGIDNPSVLLLELKELENSPGSFVEFENYRGEVRKVTWHDGFLLWDGNDLQKIDYQALLDWSKRFIRYGAEHSNAS